MSKCTWTLILSLSNDNGFSLIRNIKGIKLLLVEYMPRNLKDVKEHLKPRYDISHIGWGNSAWQQDQDSWYKSSAITGYGSCWDYMREQYPSSFIDMPERFDLVEISKHKSVLIIDKNLMTSKIIQLKEPTRSGVTCKKCNDYNQYAEAPADGSDFYCYSCRH